MRDAVPDRPCGFVNGANRCFINASLQLLYASPYVRERLNSLLTHISPRVMGGLLQLASFQPPAHAIIDSDDGNNEERLAITLRLIQEHSGPGPMMPHLILKRFYRGDQEDAHEFVMRLIQSSSAPSLACSYFGPSGTLSVENHDDSAELVEQVMVAQALSPDGVVPGFLGLYGSMRRCKTCEDEVLASASSLDATSCLTVPVESQSRVPCTDVQMCLDHFF